MNNIKNITVSAPGKLMLLGEHSVVYGHPCLVTAVDQRLHLEIKVSEKRNDITINAHDVGVQGYEKSNDELGQGEIPKGARFVEFAIKNFKVKYPFSQGLQIETKSDFSSSFGFGSSSAVTVCTLKALAVLFDVKLSSKELFDLSFKTVLDIQGTGSGFDVASAIYGGTICFVTGGKTIEQLSVTEIPLVIGYTGIKADTVTLIKKVALLGVKKPDLVEEVFGQIDNLVEKGIEVLESGNYKTFGTLMDQNQKYLAQLGVSTEKLDNMINAAKGSGAYGAKLSGAGGGDCMIALGPQESKDEIKKAIEKVGGEIMNVGTNAEGVRIE